MRQITARDIQAVLIRKYDGSNNTWMCNTYFGGGECDFLFYTRAGYCHEIEIKLTLADWNNDLKKDKWQHIDREKISYFWYCVPEDLWRKAPDWVKERKEIGILTTRPIKNEHGTYLALIEQRAASLLPNTRKLVLQDRFNIIKKTWGRYADAMKKEAKRRQYLDKDNSEHYSTFSAEDSLHSARSAGMR